MIPKKTYTLNLTNPYVTEYNTLRPHAALDYVTPDAVYYSHFSQSLTEVA